MLAAFVLVAGCQRTSVDEGGRIPMDLGPEQVWVYATHPRLPLAGREIRELVQRLLEESPDFFVVQPSPASQGLARLVVRVEDVEALAEPSENRSMRVSLRLSFPSGQVWTATGRGQGEPSEALSTAVRMALDDIVWESRAEHFPDVELVAALDTSNPDRRRIASARLAARRHPAALEPLLGALGAGCEHDGAAEALAGIAALGDPRAVRGIIGALENCEEPAFSLQAVYTLGGLGGDEAEAYLFILAEGHRDPRLRQAAKESLAGFIRPDADDEGDKP